VAPITSTHFSQQIHQLTVCCYHNIMFGNFEFCVLSERQRGYFH